MVARLGAARRLRVHVNTLLYRVGRIEQLSGRSLDDPDVRLAMTLALRARALAPASCEPHEPAPGGVRTPRPYSAAAAAPSLATMSEGAT